MKKKPGRYFWVFAWCFPGDIISWLIVLGSWAFWGTKLHWLGGLWFEFKENSWPMRTWYRRWAGTSFGHGGWYAPGRSGSTGIDTDVEAHEHVHSEQYEMSMLFGFISALAVFVYHFAAYGTFIVWLPLAIWTFSGVLLYQCSLATAYMRGEDPYRGSTLEEAAYSLGAEFERKRMGM